MAALTQERRRVTKGAMPTETGHESAIHKYQDFFVGCRGLWPMFKYVAIIGLCDEGSGPAGYLMRNKLYPKLIGRAGRGVQWGRHVTLRCPTHMEIGEGTMVDDDVLLDARGVSGGGFRIGPRVLIARQCLIQSKTDAGFIEIGEGCNIGGQSTLSSAGGIRLGRNVLIAGQCYLGGGRYYTDRSDVPLSEQGLYTLGPVTIGDGVWLGAGVRVLDGVTIGENAVVGAGAVVTRDAAANSIIAGVPAKVIGQR